MLLDSKKFDRASQLDESKPLLLNVGCGSHFHNDWTNLDLISDDPRVICHDLSTGLPFSDNCFDAVYHSHVLEHLKPNDGVKLLQECLRVLKPGGIARVVVPDLERIAKLYLEMHDKAWAGDEQAKSDYNWMKLELLDQLVREHSGGRMGQFMSDPHIQNSEFVKSRVGDEFRVCNRPKEMVGDNLDIVDRIRQSTSGVRSWLTKKLVRLLMGDHAARAFEEGLFRNSGEVHRWMYDRFSLKDLCARLGYVDFQILSAAKSQIPDFSSFQLDVIDNGIRKPDSLFTECRKPVKNWGQL